MPKFNVGDWVVCNGSNKLAKGALGFIELVNERHKIYKVQYMYDKNRNPFHFQRIDHEEDLLPADQTLAKEDIDALIDLALDMRDFEWARELVEKYKTITVKQGGFEQ